jgi:hypothetical protein
MMRRKQRKFYDTGWEVTALWLTQIRGQTATLAAAVSGGAPSHLPRQAGRAVYKAARGP